MFRNIGTNDYEKSSESPDLAFLKKDEFNLLNNEHPLLVRKSFYPYYLSIWIVK